jgi:2-polyprenyl-3-methyl-5-hydroxy-6-metoxy-1,4-benzoquinol methylase
MKRTEQLAVEEIQEGNREWWNENPMSYDWEGQLTEQPYTLAWFDAIDERFIEGSELFASDRRPFDRIIPLEWLPGKRVLEIGCGMGLHTEILARAGADVTAVDITPTAVEATTQRLRLKGLDGRVLQADAEALPFEPRSFDFVWSWGVIHHSSRTGRIVRQIARVLTPDGSCRVMVYNREGTWARKYLILNHLLRGKFLRQTFDETLWSSTDGFSARYYVREQFEDLFRAFFEDVKSEICGQEVDALPLPRVLRRLARRVIPRSYVRRAQARRGSFIFLSAARPV